MKKIIATLVLAIVMTMGSTFAMADSGNGGIIITDRGGIIITDRTAVAAITYLLTGIIITD